MKSKIRQDSSYVAEQLRDAVPIKGLKNLCTVLSKFLSCEIGHESLVRQLGIPIEKKLLPNFRLGLYSKCLSLSAINPSLAGQQYKFSVTLPEDAEAPTDFNIPPTAFLNSVNALKDTTSASVVICNLVDLLNFNCTVEEFAAIVVCPS